MSDSIASTVASLMGGGSAQTKESDVYPHLGASTNNWPSGSYADGSGTGSQMNPGGMTQGQSGGRGGLFPSGLGEGDEAQPKAARGEKPVQGDKTV